MVIIYLMYNGLKIINDVLSLSSVFFVCMTKTFKQNQPCIISVGGMGVHRNLKGWKKLFLHL